MTEQSTTLFLAVGYDRHVDDSYYLASTFEKAKQYCRDFMTLEGYERYGKLKEITEPVSMWAPPKHPEYYYVLQFEECDDAPRAWVEVVCLDEGLTNE